MASKDYYATLGLEKSATDEDIKKAFRQLAKKYHPDLHPGDKEAETKFKEINEAYSVLSDPNKRAQYDQFGSMGADGQGFGGFSGFGDFGQGGFGDSGLGDIFDMFFGGGGRGQSRRNDGPEKGADIRYDMSISFEEAAFGIKKEITINRDENCTECGGSGARKGSKPVTCPKCHGTGQIKVQQNTLFGNMVNVMTCDNCRGTGKIISDPCPVCHGRGRVKKARHINMNIPAGIDNEQIITLRGEGGAGVRGGDSGDLYVYITVKPHKFYKRNGFDVYIDKNIDYVTAALGGEIEVPTLDGVVKYKIPEATQTGTVFRLKGKGIQHLKSSGRGDQFVKVIIEVPKHLSEKQKEILRAFGESLNAASKDDKRSFFGKMKNAFGN